MSSLLVDFRCSQEKVSIFQVTNDLLTLKMSVTTADESNAPAMMQIAPERDPL